MIRFVPTGFQSKELIIKAGLNLGDVDQFPNIDVTIDGADEVDVSSLCASLASILLTFPILSVPFHRMRSMQSSEPSSRFGSAL